MSHSRNPFFFYTDVQLLLAEYGVKPTEDLLIYFYSLTSMEEESFQRLLHYLSEELGKPFTEITLSRPPHAICPNPICPPVSIKNAARPSLTTCSPAAWNKLKNSFGIVLCRLEKWLINAGLEMEVILPNALRNGLGWGRRSGGGRNNRCENRILLAGFSACGGSLQRHTSIPPQCDPAERFFV